MINLCNHYNDFNLSEGNLHFFYNITRESPTDGICGTVNICVDRNSNQSLDCLINNTNLMYK